MVPPSPSLSQAGLTHVQVRACVEYIRTRSQVETAKRLRVSQPRVSVLLARACTVQPGLVPLLRTRGRHRFRQSADPAYN